jgi:hypothetical protein
MPQDHTETHRQRQTHEADPEQVQVRATDLSEDDDGLFRIRMPVTSTGEARDGDEFSRSRVEGFREQLENSRGREPDPARTFYTVDTSWQN